MSYSNTFENEHLEHVLNNANIAGIGDATGLRGSAASGNLYLALHTSDPGEAGDQTTNEASYGSYARMPAARDGSVWGVTNNVATLLAAITFPAATSGTQTITHFSVGTLAAGAGKMLMSGPVSPNIAVSTGVAPKLGTGTSITIE